MQVVWEKQISANRITISPRPVWKCRTCEFYEKRPSCPPFVPGWREAKEWVGSYTTALLIKFKIEIEQFDDEKRKVLEHLLSVERKLFKEHPYAFALFPGACNLCKVCSFEKNGSCAMPSRLRPSMDAIGVELTSVVKINYEEPVLYGLILIE